MRDVIEWDELNVVEKAALKRKSESSFLNFTRVWFEITQNELLLVNWHHVMMADAIEDLIACRLNPGNLIINIPPGGTKTEFFSIHLPAFLHVISVKGLIKRFRNLNISYSDGLVKRNSRRTRDLIASSEYQELWPSKFGVNQAEEWEIVNDKGKTIGQTVSRAGGGQITGGRAGHYGDNYSGHVMLDDYNKPDDMFSETKRVAANRKLVNTIRSRRGDKSEKHPTPFISIQQRLHVNDATGFMISGGMGVDFHQIKIPALISEEYIESLPKKYRVMCKKSIKNSPFITKGGVKYWSYWQEMESVKDLEKLWENDDYTFLSQYQQDPKELTGNLIDTSWFKRYSVLPELQWRAIYVDTNSGKVEDHNDYTVFSLVGLGVDNNCYIIDVVRGKWDPEDLLKKAIEVWDAWGNADDSSRVRYMAIEDKQAGQGLITTLKKRRKIKVKEIPRGKGQNKLIRCNNVIPQIKGGEVFVPELYTEKGEKLNQVLYSNHSRAGFIDWVMVALKEAADFNAEDTHDNDDILDTWMDAIDDMLIIKKAKKAKVY